MSITLITGASKGIGFETARQLVELGHVVYIGARELIPRFGEPAYGSFSSPGQSVLSTDGNTTYVVSFYDVALATGTLAGMDDAKTYSARWFDPRTGTYLTISESLAPSAGSWTIPNKPDTDDWVLLVTTGGEEQKMRSDTTIPSELHDERCTRRCDHSGGAKRRRPRERDHAQHAVFARVQMSPCRRSRAAMSMHRSPS